jgi:hypothetical protein
MRHRHEGTDSGRNLANRGGISPASRNQDAGEGVLSGVIARIDWTATCADMSNLACLLRTQHEAGGAAIGNVLAVSSKKSI